MRIESKLFERISVCEQRDDGHTERLLTYSAHRVGTQSRVPCPGTQQGHGRTEGSYPLDVSASGQPPLCININRPFKRPGMPHALCQHVSHAFIQPNAYTNPLSVCACVCAFARVHAYFHVHGEETECMFDKQTLGEELEPMMQCKHER